MRRSLLAVCVVVVSVSSTVAAQDPLPLYPGNYKVVLENERVRVLDFMLRKEGPLTAVWSGVGYSSPSSLMMTVGALSELELMLDGGA